MDRIGEGAVDPPSPDILLAFIPAAFNSPEEVDRTGTESSESISQSELDSVNFAECLLAASQSIEDEYRASQSQSIPSKASQEPSQPVHPMNPEEARIVNAHSAFLDKARQFDRRRGPGREGLEDATTKLLRLLQIRGQSVFKDVYTSVDIDYRRAYDILNVLLSTDLIKKKGFRMDSSQPYQIFDDKEPVGRFCEPVDFQSAQIEHDHLVDQIQRAEKASRMMNDPLLNIEACCEDIEEVGSLLKQVNEECGTRLGYAKEARFNPAQIHHPAMEFKDTRPRPAEPLRHDADERAAVEKLPVQPH